MSWTSGADHLRTTLARLRGRIPSEVPLQVALAPGRGFTVCLLDRAGVGTPVLTARQSAVAAFIDGYVAGWRMRERLHLVPSPRAAGDAP